MSSLKTDMENPNNRSVLNTTIRREIYEEFKKSCKRDGVQMNTLIEAFMRQYNEGGFYLKLAKDNDNIEVELSE